MGELMNLIKSLVINTMDASENNTDRDITPNRNIVRSANNQRNNRIENEVLMIAPRFSSNGGILYDEGNKDWLIIPKYPLPEKWEERWCKLMIIFPETYPSTPPVGFYLNKKFKLKNGSSDGHLTGQAHYGAPDLQKNGWFWYCVRMETNSQGGWHPSADHTKPDNLWTFLNMLRESLTNDY